jgi:hypothetical protein
MKRTLIAALLCVASSVHAATFFEIEAGIGGTMTERGRDGRWIQDGLPHDSIKAAPAFEIGFTGNLYQAQYWGLDWHLDWAWLGAVHTNSLDTPDDRNYNLQTKACNGPCLPLANYRGTGHDQGFYLTLEPHADYAGWRVGIELGPYVHRTTWAEDVTGWTSISDPTPRNIHVAHDPKWILGGVAGVSISYKRFSLAYQFFYNKSPASDTTPPVWDGMHMLIAKYRF